MHLISSSTWPGLPARGPYEADAPVLAAFPRARGSVTRAVRGPPGQLDEEIGCIATLASLSAARELR